MERDRAGLRRTIWIAAAVVVFFTGIVFTYYRMLYRETQANAIATGRENAVLSADRINRYLSASADILKLSGYTLDGMLRDGSSREEILAFLTKETDAVRDSLIADTTGIYGYIGGAYLDGSGWTPEAGYDATERPWYIKAREGNGEPVIVDPYVDLDTGKAMIAITRTLSDGESVVGIDLSTDELQTLIEDHLSDSRIYEEIIINGEDRIVANADKSMIGTVYDDDSYPLGKAISDGLRSSGDDYFYLQYDYNDYIVYCMPLSYDWRYITVVDATADYLTLRTPLVIAVFAAILIVGMLAIRLSRSGRKCDDRPEGTDQTGAQGVTGKEGDANAGAAETADRRGHRPDDGEGATHARPVRTAVHRDPDMERIRNERVILFLVSLSSIGLLIESIILGWEFWVPPLILIAVASMWTMNLTGKPSYEIRSVCYYVFAMLAALYHGVHVTGLFDIALIFALAMAAFAFMDHFYMMNLLLIEYAVVMIIQFVLAYDAEGQAFTLSDLARNALHMMVVLLLYISCMKTISDRTEAKRVDKEKDERIESVDADMEDFLSNISHEFRTPVNVVNGMSDLMIRRNAGEEADAIKNAGIRLSNQIEDIQDYTECKRNKVVLEEGEYMSTSLINDVVAGFRLLENDKDLELIVDLDPRVPSRMKGDLHKLHKIFRHLLENAVKFTRRGGIYVKMYTEETDYGVNLCVEMTDTGIGMARRTIHALSEGMYQVNKKRNRSSGGIGLGLFIVYGFVHKMGGFVRIESQLRAGTTIGITIPQQVVDASPCIAPSASFDGDVLFHVRSDKYKVPRVRDFYRAMAANLAQGIRVPLYPAETVREIGRLTEKLNVKVIFMGEEEYVENTAYFDSLSSQGMIVVVSASPGFTVTRGSGVIVMPKPLYAYPVMKIINEGKEATGIDYADNIEKPLFTGIRALIVDDEPMNLVVATGLFRDYEMVIDTAGSGKEAIRKYRDNDYDVVFMDHMMPEMDGVEAMKRIREVAGETHRSAIVIALTANAVSGAREMFIREGFDGFIAKPINLADFERVMLRELGRSGIDRKGAGRS